MTFPDSVWVAGHNETLPGEPARAGTWSGAACPAQTHRLDRTTRRLGSGAELAVSSGLAETRLKQSSPSAVALLHSGPPRLAKSRDHPAGSPTRRRPQTGRSLFVASRTPRLRDSRGRPIQSHGAAVGAAILRGRPADVAGGGPYESPSAQDHGQRALVNRRTCLVGDGGAGAGPLFPTAAWPSQHRAASLLPDGTT